MAVQARLGTDFNRMRFAVALDFQDAVSMVKAVEVGQDRVNTADTD